MCGGCGVPLWLSVLGVIVSYIVGVVVAVKGRRAVAEDPVQSADPENLGEDLGQGEP